MAWRPSTETLFSSIQSNPFWEAIQTVYDSAYPSAPLPRCRMRTGILARHYICDRQGYASYSREAMLSTLPRRFRHCRIGPAEIDCLDLLFNLKSDRILSIVGTRGAGKTTFIHYIEYLLEQNRTANTPILVILNGNREETNWELQIAEEIEMLAQRAATEGYDERILHALELGTSILKNGQSRTATLRALGAIRDALPNKDSRLFILVFDNLDPLPIDRVETAYQWAREIFLATGIGAILCVRPSLFRKVGDRGAARQFASFYIRIYPPTLRAWLATFGERMRTALKDLPKEDGPRKAHNQKITLARLERACQRFVSFFQNRPSTDDPTEFLESVASQDMRHLNALVRQMLQNSRLPSEFLLSPDETVADYTVQRFHPLSAAMEGQHTSYRRSSWICNVLCFEKETVHFLIFHRLLSVLADNDPKETIQVLRWMEEYGYHRSLTTGALEVLRECNLVYGSDLDKRWDNSHRPEFCGLTAGGKYFLNRLFANADYLTAAVLDVPLEHKQISRESIEDSFAPRLYSLFEYLVDVRERENRQLSEMKRREPSDALLVATDRLRGGNTLTSKILRGLKDAIMRARSSESRRVQVTAQELVTRLVEYQHVVRKMEDALLEIRRKAAKRPVPFELPLLSDYDPHTQSTLQVKFGPLGEGVEARVTMETTQPTGNAILVITDPHAGQRMVETVCLQPEAASDPNSKLVGKFGWQPPLDALAPQAPGIQTISIPPQRRSVAILSVVRDRNKGANLDLTVIRDRIPEKLPIGQINDCEQLRQWAEAQLIDLGNLLKNRQPIEKRVRSIGVALGSKVLDAHGRERLLQIYREIDSCLISIDPDLRVLPWEWLTADSAPECHAISDSWDIVRWHPPRKGGKKFMRALNTESSANKLVFETIGLPMDPAAKWRCDWPKNINEFLEWLQKKGRKHIVAHQKEGNFFFDTETWWITCDDIAGNIPVENRLPDEIVLSSCDAAVLHDPNVAVIFAELWRCQTWAPLTVIDTPDALAVDEYLASVLHGGGLSLSDAIRLGRDEQPLLELYVKYGVHLT